LKNVQIRHDLKIILSDKKDIFFTIAKFLIKYSKIICILNFNEKKFIKQVIEMDISISNTEAPPLSYFNEFMVLG
jgi:hypothetical protein